MATTITSAPSESTPNLSSQLYSIEATTDKVKVVAEITRDPDGDIDKFYTATLYAYNGTVELADIGSLIEEQLRLKNKMYDTFEVKIDDAVATFPVLHCEYELSPDFDCKSCFLAAAGESVVTRLSSVDLHHWPTDSNVYNVKIIGLDAQGNTAALETTLTGNAAGTGGSFYVQKIVDYALNPTDDNAGHPLAKVAYFAIWQGKMRKVYYYVDRPDALIFYFRNIFNAIEQVAVVGTVTRKTKVDRDTAMCGGKLQGYNQSYERTYEVQTAPLTPSQVLELEQMISSRQVQLMQSNYDYDVIITDHTLESDNDDESLPSIKFTFRFVGRRPTIPDNNMGFMMVERNNVFTNEFSDEFV